MCFLKQIDSVQHVPAVFPSLKLYVAEKGKLKEKVISPGLFKKAL